MDLVGLGAFLRTRRAALQPEDVGLPRGPRRRTSGLRREEVASLVGMSPDYYARLERGAGPQPSEQMVAAIARGLRLSLPERDHLFTLAGHTTPRRTSRTDHVGPALMRVLDRLQDTPAQVMGGLGETLVQTPQAVALLGARPTTSDRPAARSTDGSPTRPHATSTSPPTTTCTGGPSPPNCDRPPPAADPIPPQPTSPENYASGARSSPPCGTSTRSASATPNPNASPTRK